MRLPDLSYFVAPQRANPHWQKISPAEAEVYIDEETCATYAFRSPARRKSSRFVCAGVGDTSGIPSLPVRARPAYAATAMRAGHCATANLDREPG